MIRFCCRLFFILSYLWLPLHYAIANDDTASDESRIEDIVQDILNDDARDNQRQRAEDLESRSNYQTGTELQQIPENVKVESDRRCLKTRDLIFDGASLISQEQLSSWQQEVRDAQCFSLGLLAKIVREVANFYLTQGFITSQPIKPRQDEQGRIVIPIVEGMLSSVSVTGGEFDVDTVYPNYQESPFNMRDLEQALEQINRLRSLDYTSDLRPGKEYATSDIILRPTGRRDGRPWYGNISYNNFNDPGTVSVSLGYDNPLGYLGSLNVSHSREWFNADRESRSYSLRYGVPYGYSNFNASYSVSTTKAEIPSVRQGVIVRKTKNQRVKADWSMLHFRNQRSTFSHYLSLTYADIDNETRFPGDILFVNEGATEQITSADLGVRYSYIGRGKQFSVGLGYDTALKELGTEENPSQILGDQVNELPDAHYGLWHLDMNFTKYFTPRNWFNSQVVAQQSEDYLPNHKRFSIGGYYSVRGVENYVYSGNSGYYFRNTMSFRLPTAPVFSGLNSIFTLGADMGEILSDDRYPNRQLTGLNMGLSLSYADITAKVDMGRTLYNSTYQPLGDLFFLGQLFWRF